MKYFASLLFIGSLLVSFLAEATPASDVLFLKYKSEGASNFDIERGKIDWHKEIKGEDSAMLSCGSCHGSDLSQSGKHRKTNKVIEPMAASANSQRFTDAQKTEKWFKRNCNDIWKRDCTAQEKGDILKYLLSI